MPPRATQPAEPPRPIRLSKVLVVEGQDAVHFFVAMLKELGRSHDIEIRDWRSVFEWPQYVRTLRATPGFGEVVSLGFVRDAEDSAESAFQSVCGLVRGQGLCAPKRPTIIANGHPRVSVFILPDCERSGMLESLCWQSIGDDPVRTCIEQYLACVEKMGAAPFRNPAKAQVHAFLASRVKPDLQLGEAAAAGYFPWASPAFEKLKAFLCAL